MADDQNITNQGEANLGSSSGQKPEEISSTQSGGGSMNNNSSNTVKRPKTEKQRERERERRRRRRRKKVDYKAGEDVPLILTSKEGKEKGRGPRDATLREAPGLAEEIAVNVQDVPKIPDLANEDQLAPLSNLERISESDAENKTTEEKPSEESSADLSTTATSQAESTLLTEPSESAAAELPSVPTATSTESETESVGESEVALSETGPEPESEVSTEPVLKEETPPDIPVEPYPPSETHLDESQQIFEESPSYLEEKPSEETEVVSSPAVEELPMLDEDAHADLLSEEDLAHVRKTEAKNIVEDLHSEKPSLEEVPQKQWILGNLIKTLASIVAVILLIIGAFWLGSSLHLPDLVKNLFASKPGEELVQGDNSQVVQDPELFRRWGFQTATIMGRNQGDVRDLAYNIFFNANYFGKLKDPVFYGETGVTAALYYGFGREAEYLRNKFIYYVKYLAQVRQANQVKVADVLDGKLRRDQALDAYIADLKAIFEQGNTLRKEINVQIDDLKVSINSLNPDKDRFEVDFFASLSETEAEKADALIAKFIEISQKQTDLKAKLAALSKLTEYYEEDLIIMKLRIEGLEQNREALIEGVTIREVPGSGIDLIRE